MTSDSGGQRKLHDISPPVGRNSVVWPGDSPFEHRWTWSLDRGDSVNVARLTLSPHTGAHADAPLHVIAGSADCAGLDLTAYWGRARVFDWIDDGPITADRLAALQWQGVERALFRTRSAGEAMVFDDSFAHFTVEGAEFLVGHGLRLAGLDTPSVDSFSSKKLPAHHALLAGGVAILESLELGHVEPGDYELVALPLRLEGLDASPVRAVLRTLG